METPLSHESFRSRSRTGVLPLKIINKISNFSFDNGLPLCYELKRTGGEKFPDAGLIKGRIHLCEGEGND